MSGISQDEFKPIQMHQTCATMRTAMSYIPRLNEELSALLEEPTKYRTTYAPTAKTFCCHARCMSKLCRAIYFDS